MSEELLYKEKPILKQNHDLHIQLSESREKIAYLKEEIAYLKKILYSMRKAKFGSSKEIHVDSSTIPLFNEVESEAEKIPLLLNNDEGQVISYTRKKGRKTKKGFPEDLPREEVILDLKQEEKVCSDCGNNLKEMGEATTEKLKTIPARTIVVVEKRKKYTCTVCEGNIVEAKSKSVLPKSIATPELLSYLLFSKFIQGLPLYRLEELYRSQKIHLTRGTMARWLVQISEKLIPIWNLLEEKAMGSDYMAMDATHVQVLKEGDRKAESKSFMWVRGSPEQGIVLFDYDVSGGGAVAKRLMRDFCGGLQTDAHKCYNALENRKIILLGCMMHARRRFYQAWERGGKKEGLANIGLNMIKKLYKFEKSYKDKGLSNEQRYEAREKEVRPYLESIKSWCERKSMKVFPKSELGNAMSYFINQYERLSGFLKKGKYEIDNGWVERVIRKFAIGRNNWLFSDTVAGAKASSLLYSLVLTAKLNEKCSYTVMTEVLQKLPDAHSIDDYEALARLFLKEGSTSLTPSPSTH